MKRSHDNKTGISDAAGNADRQSAIELLNKFVNWLSGLSLLIYIIHENILVRSYLRPYVFQRIYLRFGYEHIVLWVLLLAGFYFICAVIAGAIYKSTLQKLLHRMSDIVYPALQRTCLRLESRLMSLK